MKALKMEKNKVNFDPPELFDYENGNYPSKAHLQCLSVLNMTLFTEVCTEKQLAAIFVRLRLPELVKPVATAVQ